MTRLMLAHRFCGMCHSTVAERRCLRALVYSAVRRSARGGPCGWVQQAARRLARGGDLKRGRAARRRDQRLRAELEALSTSELRDKTTEFRGRLLAGETLDDLLPEAFAGVREAARRTIGMRHYDVQLIGGASCTAARSPRCGPARARRSSPPCRSYLNALTGKGVHLVTVNDYLARATRSGWGQVYHALGLTVGVIQHEAAFIYDPTYQAEEPSMTSVARPHRREAYAADITYGTNNEFGFDYLRDNMVWAARRTWCSASCTTRSSTRSTTSWSTRRARR